MLFLIRRRLREINLTLHELAALARGAAEADDAAFPLAPKGENVTFMNRGITLIADFIIGSI